MNRSHSSRLPLWSSLYLSWILLLFWLSVTSTPSPVKLDIALEDKIHHAMAYAVLAFLGEKTWRYLPGVKRAWLWSLSIALLFGALMEGVQATYTAVRVAEWADWIADGVGAVVALALNALLQKKRRQVS